MPPAALPQRFWKLCCSLKVAIVLASLATIVAMGGSLVMHFNPAVFGDLDRITLSLWFARHGAASPTQSWWLALLALLLVLLALNTLCCLLDWCLHLRSRWRKTGEYLLHFGFVLIVAGFLWGSLAGYRHPGLRLGEGETVPLPQRPGWYLRLESFSPVLGSGGRPMDLRSTVSLLQGDRVVRSQTIRSNHPLTWEDLVILPESFDREIPGFAAVAGGGERIELIPGAEVPLQGDLRLRVLEFYPDALVTRDRRVRLRSSQLGDPALLLELQGPGLSHRQGWYFLREQPPRFLIEADPSFRATGPLVRMVSVLTLNSDPGAGVAAGGAVAMLLGVSLALFSFYRKRSAGDRPDIV